MQRGIKNEKQKNTRNEIIRQYGSVYNYLNVVSLYGTKNDNGILLEFIRQSIIDDMNMKRMPGWYSIRFRTSGSTYTPCDLAFTRHFLKMQEYDFNAPHQIHIEEWCYSEKQLRKK